MTEKGKFLKKFNEAFAKMDLAYIIENVTDDIDWTMVGEQHIRGKDEFRKAMEEMAGGDAYTVEIDQIITHGTSASVNGIMTSPKGSSFGFCDIYVFSSFKNPKIKKMTSYVIEMK